ncbi:MAG: spermidine synthase [Streptosporangiales bacterium]
MSVATDAPIVLGRAAGARGNEVVLRVRRAPGGEQDVHELIVGGVFAIDTVDSSTERLLATAALDRLSGGRLAVLVGGLGFGYTVRALLADPRVHQVQVAELEPSLVEWLGADLVPPAAGLLDDPRVTTHVGDVHDVVCTAEPGSLDAILLDVDNGPSFLVHGTNARVYEAAFLRSCLRRLRPGGVLAIWAADRSPQLRDSLEALGAACEEITQRVERDGRSVEYVVYLAKRAGHGA